MSAQMMAIVALSLVGGTVMLLLLIKAARWARYVTSEMQKLNSLAVGNIRTSEAKLEEHEQAIGAAIAIAQLENSFPVFLGDASIDAHHARALIHQLVALKPRTVVELGAGSSTIITARAMRYLCIPDFMHLAVDHEQKYLELAKDWARLASVADRVKFVLAPLKALDKHPTKWYSGIPEHLHGRSIDLLLVDGPPAYEEGFDLARYPALPELSQYLSLTCTVMLDDANRPGESEIINRWLAEFPGFTLTRVTRGKGVAILQRAPQAG